jgi:hypothetical protein
VVQRFNGRWIEVQVDIITAEEARRGMRHIACKYIPWKQFLDVLSAFSRHSGSCSPSARFEARHGSPRAARSRRNTFLPNTTGWLGR